LVFSLVPRCQGLEGFAEVDLDVAVDREAGVLGHLFTLIPGQRAPKRLGQPLAVLGQSNPYRLGGAPVRKPGKHRESCLSFDEGRDRGASGLADDQVALPVAGDGAVGDLRRPFGERDDFA
jgi:hypothetical protein